MGVPTSGGQRSGGSRAGNLKTSRRVMSANCLTPAIAAQTRLEFINPERPP